ACLIVGRKVNIGRPVDDFSIMRKTATVTWAVPGFFIGIPGYDTAKVGAPCRDDVQSAFCRAVNPKFTVEHTNDPALARGYRRQLPRRLGVRRLLEVSR